MSFISRSYGGRHLMPTPHFFLEKDENFLIVVFSWGNQEVSKKITHHVQTLITLMLEDREMTSPFEFLSCLHPYGNHIRTSLMLTNDNLFYGENEEEYSAGVEILILLRNKTSVYWSQVGNFNIFLNRPSLNLKLLEVSSDLSSELSSTSSDVLFPLPNKLLGVDSTLNISVKEFHYEKNDEIILLNRSVIPEEIFSLPNQKRNMNSISKICSSNHKDLPFWLGLLSLV